ncbi:MAG TPA: hypothetical protein VLL50_09775 [Usitatibacter sp.]|nr:hypothetical protein [Usitatibacter sp.]
MTDNVFAPPRSNVVVNTGPQELWDLSWKDFRNLYYASVNIRAIGILNIIGSVIVIAALAIPAFSRTDTTGAGSLVPLFMFMGLASALSIVFAWTAFTRPRWGRWFGIVMLVLGLINFPIGTLISIVGLIAYVRGRRLFGDDKISHKDLAEVFKQRKVEKK